MPATATALLHIIGIVLMTSEPAPYRGIAPRIGNPPAAVRQQARHGDDGPTTITDIEPHTAFLAFAKSDLRPRNRIPGAQPFNDPALADLLYLPVDGVQITFESVVPPSAALMSASSHLMLARLSTWCPGAKSLRKEYQPPHYSAAAAVIDLSGVGSVTTCSSTAHASLPSRLDTQVMIPNGGELVIAIKKNGRFTRVHLNGDAHFYFANLPTWFLTGADHAGNSRPHYEAYFKMVVPPSQSPPWHCSWFQPAAARTVATTTTTTAAGPLPCFSGEAMKTAVMPTDTAIIGWSARIDAECANSQWP